MKSTFTKIISLLLVLMLSLTIVGCRDDEEPGNGGNNGGGTDNPAGDYVMPEDEYRLPKEEGHNQITFYWSYPGVIENCDVWVWWDGKEGGYNGKHTSHWHRRDLGLNLNFINYECSY